MNEIWNLEFLKQNLNFPKKRREISPQMQFSMRSDFSFFPPSKLPRVALGVLFAITVFFCVAFSVMFFLTGHAVAQTTKAAPAETAVPSAVPVEPSTTTASYGDWVLRCEKPQAERICEIVLTVQIQGQNSPIAQIAVGKVSSDAPLTTTALLPAFVSFPSNVLISAEGDEKVLELNWRRCLPTGCFADAAITDNDLKQWRAATKPGRLSFKDASERQIALPVSYRGFTQALEALTKQNP